MSQDTNSPEATGPGADEATEPDGVSDRVFDGELLSDLFVNAVPIAIIAAFVLMFGLLSPAGEGDPLVLFHGALVAGVVLVSVVSGWLIRREDSPLEGSAATDPGTESEADADPD
jgi:hypothetical protein